MPPSSDESLQLLGLSRVTAHAEPVHGHHRGYADLYADVLRNQRMCLCGMLAAEYTTLPDAMQASVVSFFGQNKAWLRDVLEQGRSDGSLQFTGSTRDAARMIISCLEGAMLVARPYGDIQRFQDAAASLMTGLTSPSVIRR
jgi:TetR/AcrR family transcriptional regulator, transcriptional repressor for nem operon